MISAVPIVPQVTPAKATAPNVSPRIAADTIGAKIISTSDAITANIWLDPLPCGSVTSAGNIAGDLITGGSNIVVSGDVGGDILAGGGNINILSKEEYHLTDQLFVITTSSVDIIRKKSATTQTMRFHRCVDPCFLAACII